MTILSLSFIFLFLPLTVLGYYLIRSELKNLFLVFASLLFYALGDPGSIALLLLNMVLNYILGAALGKNVKAAPNRSGGYKDRCKDPADSWFAP